MDYPIDGKYQVEQKIVSEPDGNVYLGRDMTTGRHCAIKVEPTNAPFRGLHREFAVYERLYGRAGIPTVECYSRGSHHKAMVMELLGPSLEELLSTWKAGFSLKTVLMLGHQLLSLLEYIHSKGIIHRNLKPSAALMGLGEKGSQVHLVSFGLSQWYARHGEHISYREGKPLLCSPLFASLNAHLGVEQGRRDDLESLAYVLIYLLRGKLPWQKSWRISTSELCHEVVRERKMAVAVEDLFEGVPAELASFLHYCRSLRFSEAPDYSHLQRLLRGLFETEGFSYDCVFDWSQDEAPFAEVMKPKAHKHPMHQGGVF